MNQGSQNEQATRKEQRPKDAKGARTRKRPKNKARPFRWKGVLAGSERMIRRTSFIVLVVAGATFTYTQLGFVDLQLPDGTVGYMVALLQVVALGALLLGTLAGTILGLIIGSVLLLHAQLLPLDHYELAFVTPLTSIVMFGICGALLGMLFAFALRNNPSRIKRVIYIFIVCIAVALFYCFNFSVNVLFSLIVTIVETTGGDIAEENVASLAVATFAQLGDIGVQLWSTGLLMALICSIGDYVADKVKAYKSALGLRATFGIWLGVVVVLAFMTMSAFSFAIASINELSSAEEFMRGEVSYLKNLLDKAAERSNVLEVIFEQGELDYDKIDTSLIEEYAELFEDKLYLEGYTPEEDGTIVFLVEDMIYASDDERFENYITIEEAFPQTVVTAIERSKETGEMQRCIYYSPNIEITLPEDTSNEPASEDTSDEPASEDASDESASERKSEDEEALPVDEVTDEEIQDINTQVYIAYVYAEDASATIKNLHGEDIPINQTIVMMKPSDQVFAQRPTVMAGMTFSALVMLSGVFVIVFLLLNRVVARRIDETNSTLARITAGDLDAHVEVNNPLEFESLAEGINATVDTLKGWIAEAEERMDAELATAWTIQEAVLPRIFPPFPNILKFDIFASMKPARQVGGDFYDFFLIGEDCNETSGKLAFVVADVSGKGIPAALFMMRAKALLHDYVSEGLELGEAVEEANRQLLDGNDEGMFVTAWIGVLDYGTGHVDYVNAGHNPPLLWQREGGWQWMKQKSGPVLGLFEVPYRAHSVDCVAGDTFLLYTDGVTEAFDVNEALYGEERLFALADESYRLHPRELLETVFADVAAYSEGAEQSDDITVLALEVGVPPEVTATLTVPAEISELERVNSFLHAELDKRLCPQRTQNQLDIAVEELFVNVCKYAYPEDQKGTVRIQRTYSADPQSITVDIIDDGIPYDPLAKPDAVTPSNIEDVPIGGLGILMAKKCTDEMYYERVDESNIVTIVKKW
jgi:anti-sigma regulatory factor (Ser/Thr protein kinase)